MFINYVPNVFIDINNDFCLLPYGNCEYLSDQHVTITYDNVRINFY